MAPVCGACVQRGPRRPRLSGLHARRTFTARLNPDTHTRDQKGVLFFYANSICGHGQELSVI
ncbi:uncharacterized protein B0H18DRAFT_983192, partial [Fomitopsis serialis]|uniref:uncharacterized protein n=1 Tax=Fomitopsis serialis TaxID=139415 RepID=UPI002007A8C8